MVTGSVSALSSSTIIASMMLRSSSENPRTRRGLSTSYRRIIFGMSVFDISVSLASAVSTLASPSNVTGFWNVGNKATCSIQGFFGYMGFVGVPLYSVSLCMHYVCKARFQMTDERFRTRVEPFLHAVPIFYSVSTGILFLAQDLFHSLGNPTVCFLTAYPTGCQHSSDIECERGKNYM